MVSHGSKRAVLTPKGRRWWQSGHPWLYRDDLAVIPQVAPGDICQVYDQQGRFLGQAFYSSRSRIALRFISYGEQQLDLAFWEQRLLQALAYRRRVVQDTDAYRLIYAEADGFPGLIVDYYAGHLVVQIHHPGPERLLPVFVDLWRQHLQPRSIILRNDSEVRRLEGLSLEVKLILGDPPSLLQVREGPLELVVDPFKGQKTGLFLDQRENRQVAAQLAQGRVLDCFAYQGGFALHAARLARQVVAVESSGAALSLAQENAQRNRLTNIEWVQANCFAYLKEAVAAGQSYDMVILDPPAFAKSRSDRQAAAQGYREINRRALQLLTAGGILVTCSCSYNLSQEDFLQLLRQAAWEAKRQVRLVEQRGAARDHPVLLALPESYYLKCLICQVE